MLCPLSCVMNVSACQSDSFKKKYFVDLFYNYHHIQCVCNHSAELVNNFLGLSFILPHFWHIQNFIDNLDSMPLTMPHETAKYNEHSSISRVL
jgi:hypothetical protein